TVTFGAMDAPLTGKDLDESGLAQFPMVMGGIVPVLNVEGLLPGDLVLDGATLAKIFLGEVETGNDPAIQTLNAGVKLPNRAIAIVHRSDDSGTTYNFTYYLSEVSPDWRTKVGTNTAVEWPGGLGAKGNEGVANNVAQTKGSIGYVEYAYAKQNKLIYAKMISKDGKVVTPSSETFQAAAANADWNSKPGYGAILANQPGATSWPMTAAIWILLYKKPQDPTATAEALSFLPGHTPRGTRWRTNSIMCRCLIKWWATSKRCGRPRSRMPRASRYSLHANSASERRKRRRQAPLPCWAIAWELRRGGRRAKLAGGEGGRGSFATGSG